MKGNILIAAVLTAGILSAKAQSANSENTLQANVSYASVNTGIQTGNNLQEAPMYTQPVYILDETTPSEKVKAKRKRHFFSFLRSKKRKSSGSF